MKNKQTNGRIMLSKRINKEGVEDPLNSIGKLSPINLNKKQCNIEHNEDASAINLSKKPAEVDENIEDANRFNSLFDEGESDDLDPPGNPDDDIEIKGPNFIWIVMAAIIMLGIMQMGSYLTNIISGQVPSDDNPPPAYHLKIKPVSYHYCTPWSPKTATVENKLKFIQKMSCGEFNNGVLVDVEEKTKSAVGTKKITSNMKLSKPYNYCGPWHLSEGKEIRICGIIDNGLLIKKETMYR